MLNTGPTGLLSVWVAIAAAARNPIEAPMAVMRARGARIHPRPRATKALATAPSSPPTTPPAISPRGPAAWPMIEPNAAPSPANKHATMNNASRCIVEAVDVISPPKPTSREQRLDDEQDIGGTLGQAPHVPAIPCRSITDQCLHDVAVSDEAALGGVADPVQHVDLIIVFSNA